MNQLPKEEASNPNYKEATDNNSGEVKFLIANPTNPGYQGQDLKREFGEFIDKLVDNKEDANIGDKSVQNQSYFNILKIYEELTINKNPPQEDTTKHNDKLIKTPIKSTRSVQSKDSQQNDETNSSFFSNEEDRSHIHRILDKGIALIDEKEHPRSTSGEPLSEHKTAIENLNEIFTKLQSDFSQKNLEMQKLKEDNEKASLAIRAKDEEIKRIRAENLKRESTSEWNIIEETHEITKLKKESENND